MFTINCFHRFTGHPAVASWAAKVSGVFLLSAAALSAHAQDVTTQSVHAKEITALENDSVPTSVVTVTEVKTEEVTESLFPEVSRSLWYSHFTWGAEVGCSIDLTGHNMSTFDLDVLFGYKSDYFRLIGLGAGVHRSFGANNMFIPVYVAFRSSFRKKPSPVFLSVKAGYSFNTIADAPTYGDVSATIGLGVNLAMSRKFHSHIIIGWSFRHFTENHKVANGLDTNDIQLANVAFGINF